METILLTGCAGFIGMHASLSLLQRGYTVLGIDNLCDYYSPELKKSRLKKLSEFSKFSFYQIDITDYSSLERIFLSEKPDKVLHLAAQPGVRYSFENPQSYFLNNQLGFGTTIELSQKYGIKHFVYASSSSVYGSIQEIPFHEGQAITHPISLYAATKVSNEMVAHSYSYNYKLPTTGLRFFTVYGPYGRPDMATFIFTKAICDGKPIKLYNFGEMKRDFTYIDDIVSALSNIIEREKSISDSMDDNFKIFNIGNNSPVSLKKFLSLLEIYLGKKAIVRLEPLQNGDMLETYADISLIQKEYNFKPETSIEEGLKKFVDWYLAYYNLE
ncbi:MAG: GDP-mannose 4,6-dehydratase [Leptospiraceae bacterium]|nr:GDP-mannose 4,6-dehydratase [Leptospiraceae bacterium]MCP5501510.1 GDP-mannose 4,6-dehydratase [Leptospiraceae bacterium]